MVLLHAGIALAGYGDAVDGLPTHADRETFFWTNVVRADPEALRGDYPCNFDAFEASEKTPKPLYRIDTGLMAAASFHSNDMHDQGYFDHDSIDGTPWDQRIRRYYTEGTTIGENIAQGYRDPRSAVVEGWMCSSGHRANLLSTAFNELGTGVAGTYYTQDFGRGDVPPRAMTLGLHLPEEPRGSADLAVDFDADAGPDELFAVVAGVRVDLQLQHGTELRGVWGATVEAGTGCRPYYFVARGGSRTETWPAEGSYGWGDCAWDDAGARWLASQLPIPTEEPADTGTTDTGTASTDDTGTAATTPGTTDEDPLGSPETTVPPEPSGCGCASHGAGSVPVLGLAVSALLLRRAPDRRARRPAGPRCSRSTPART